MTQFFCCIEGQAEFWSFAFNCDLPWIRFTVQVHKVSGKLWYLVNFLVNILFIHVDIFKGFHLFHKLHLLTLLIIARKIIFYQNLLLIIDWESLPENLPEILPWIITTNIFIVSKCKKFCNFDLFECDMTYLTRI